MEYFASKNHNRLNHRAFTPEKVSSHICLNPSYPVTLGQSPGRLNVLLDSGAFQDTAAHERLSFQAALDRQLCFEREQQVSANYLVSYDRIVDETPTIQGHRKKRRVPSQIADRYVSQTIDAAKFLSDHRRELEPRRLVLSNQGISPDQYVDCIKEVLRFAEPSDVIGLGGFCIIGQVPRLTADYFEVLRRALPLLKRRRIRRIHVFGVGVFSVLIKTHVVCSLTGIVPSYDTSSLELNAVFGRTFQPDTRGIGPAGVHLTSVFTKEDKYKLYHPCDWALLNIKIVNEFWRELNQIYPLPNLDTKEVLFSKEPFRSDRSKGVLASRAVPANIAG